jgi:VanZ family protein
MLLRSSPRATRVATSAAGLARHPTFYPLIIATVVVCAGALEPFDVTLDVSSVVPKMRALLHDPWQGGPFTDEGLSILQHLLFGSTLVIWLRAVRPSGAVMIAAVVGAVGSVALESSQLFIGARMPGARDALVGVVGCLCGVALAGSFSKLKRPALWCAGVFILTAVGVAMQQLSPFTWGAQAGAFQWVPFLHYRVRTMNETVSHSAELLLSYLPLGFAIALTIEHRIARLVTAILATLLIAVPVAYLQRFVDGRHPDMTDTALSVVGVGFGLWAATAGWRRFDAELARLSH